MVQPVTVPSQKAATAGSPGQTETDRRSFESDLPQRKINEHNTVPTQKAATAGGSGQTESDSRPISLESFERKIQGFSVTMLLDLGRSSSMVSLLSFLITGFAILQPKSYPAYLNRVFRVFCDQFCTFLRLRLGMNQISTYVPSSLEGRVTH